ncbi:MAG TPA: phosphatidylserine decarboxylase [Rhizomicrobium sp.]|nr:phosphatidylserine decarboxylase [Rhizomicrobium sp.]
MRIPIHPQGWPFIVPAVLVNAILVAAFGWWGLIALPVTLWVISFFRDPERQTPSGPGLIISPADGILLPVVEAPPPPELDMGPEPRTRLSIFMTFFHVHVNRAPEAGTVEGLAYRPGKFFNASFDKASEHNERMAIRLKLADGRDLVVVQIAGLVARRIFCALSRGQMVCRGERIGLIRFGSRVDVYLPPGAKVRAQPGKGVKAGETVLAELV